MLSQSGMSAIPSSHEIPDERLVRALTSGEAAAFDELYRRYARRLAAYGARLLGDPSAGEDVAQIALLNAYQALRRGTEPAQVRAWLFRIAHNAALEILSRRRELVEFNEEHHRSEDPQELSAARGALLSALAALPERQRAAYVLREVRGLRMSEIGERLDLSQQQVEQALFAARNRLAERLTFGTELDCETAVGLGASDTHRATQRALKRHLRACVSCRAASRRTKRGVGLLGPLGLLRDVAAWLAGLGAAPAAKVSAVAAAAAIAAGTPVLAGSAGADDAPREPTASATPAAVEPRDAVVSAPPRRATRTAAAPARSAGHRPVVPARAPVLPADSDPAPATAPAPEEPAAAAATTAGDDAVAPEQAAATEEVAHDAEPAPADESYADTEPYADEQPAPVEDEPAPVEDEPAPVEDEPAPVDQPVEGDAEKLPPAEEEAPAPSEGFVPAEKSFAAEGVQAEADSLTFEPASPSAADPNEAPAPSEPAESDAAPSPEPSANAAPTANA
jgi:RNA polymerase sigma factor (sigma-70 family)